MFKKVAVCAAVGGLAMLATGAHAQARDSTYGAPEPAYGPPEPSYEEPAGYSAPAPSYGAVEEAVPDLTPIIIGILVLTGLSLLFPTYVTLTSVRRRRSVQEDEEPTIMERMVDIMESVTTSEGCMERIACEVGGMADQAGMDKTMSRLAESFVSKKAQKLMKKFNGSQDCRKIKCGMF